MTDDHLDELIGIWVRWCRVTRAIGTCGSVERNWRSPQEWYEKAPVPPPKGSLTARELTVAIQVNRAWQHMPEPFKYVLSDWYVVKRNPRITCRNLALPFAEHPEYLFRSRRALINLLTSQGKRAKRVTVAVPDPPDRRAL